MPSKIADAVAKALSEANLFHDRIALGVSGGSDSLALVAGVLENRAASGRDVIVVHFDHRLRPESADDADFVREICRKYGLAFRLGHGTQFVVGANRRPSEETARDARYAFFADVVNETGCAAVLVGHTAQDQTETRLLHLVRGSGLRGLRGMATDSQVTVRSGQCLRILRPLLVCTHHDTVAYCQAIGLEPRFDRSNGDRAYTRNRLRHEVVPELLKINPRVDQALDRLGRIAADAEDFLESELECRLSSLVKGGPADWDIDRAAWRHLPRALKRTLIRRTAASSRSRRDIGADLVEIILESIDSASAGTMLTLSNGWSMRIDHDRAVVESAAKAALPGPATSILVADDSDTPLEPGVYLDGRRGPSIEEQDSGPLRLRIRHRAARCDGRLGDRRHADLDRAKLGNVEFLQVRSWRRGDLMCPEGMTGRKKLQDLFVDAKIPRVARASIPILATPEGKIAWIVGLRRDRCVLADASSTDVLCIDVVDTEQGETAPCPG